MGKRIELPFTFDRAKIKLKGSEGGGVQFPLVDRDQVSNTVQVRTVKAKAESGSLQVRSPGSDSRERPATSAEEMLAHKRALKAAAQRRFRAKQKTRQ